MELFLEDRAQVLNSRCHGNAFFKIKLRIITYSYFTGGYSEFDFEHSSSEVYAPRHTAQENVKLQRMGKRWTVVSGPCKGSSSVEDLRKCVTSKQPTWTDDYNVSPNRQGEKYALMKPASAGVDVNSRNPSLENVIRANKLPSLKPLYGKMKTLQDQVRIFLCALSIVVEITDTLQLNVIKNPRNLDTEDLTSETSDDWLGQTANLCCANMYDTVCNQPCHAF